MGYRRTSKKQYLGIGLALVFVIGLLYLVNPDNFTLSLFDESQSEGKIVCSGDQCLWEKGGRLTPKVNQVTTLFGTFRAINITNIDTTKPITFLTQPSSSSIFSSCSSTRATMSVYQENRTITIQDDILPTPIFAKSQPIGFTTNLDKKNNYRRYSIINN